MHVKTSLSTIFLYLVAAPVTATAPEIEITQPAAIINTDTASADLTQSSDLVCQGPVQGGDNRDAGRNGECDENQEYGHGRGADYRSEVEDASDFARRKPQISVSSGCDKPGDVFEQGVCLD